jgi:hypothetical protein
MGEGQGKGMGYRRNHKMSRCERKEHIIKKIQTRNCIVDKINWVSKDGMVDMEKLKSSSNMGNMFMKKGGNKCMEIIDIVEVEQKLKSMMDVKGCQRDKDTEKNSSEKGSSSSRDSSSLEEEDSKVKERMSHSVAKNTKAHDLNRSYSVTLKQGKGKADTYVMDQELVKEMMEMSNYKLRKK